MGRIDINIIYQTHEISMHFIGREDLVKWVLCNKCTWLAKWAICGDFDDDTYNMLSDLVGTKGYEQLSVVRANEKSKLASYRTRGMFARPIGTK